MRVQLDKEGGYTLDQEETISDLLRDNGLAEANLTHTSIGNDCYEVEVYDAELLETASVRAVPTIREFQLLVGLLLCVASCTRPNIAFAVHKTTRQMHAPCLLD